jgi:hypothetical protein
VSQKWAANGSISAVLVRIGYRFFALADENLFTVLRAGEMRIQSVPFLKSKRRFRLSFQRFMPKPPIIELTSFGDALSFP